MPRLALAALLLALAVAGCGIAGTAKIEAPVTVYVSLPLTGPHGARRPRRRRWRATGAGAGSGQGRLDPGPADLSRRRQGQDLGPGRRRGQRPPGGPGLIRRCVHRRARLGADPRLGADHQRRRPGAGLAGSRRGGPDPGRRRLSELARPLPALRLAQLRSDGAGGRRGRRRSRQLGVGARRDVRGGDLRRLRLSRTWPRPSSSPRRPSTASRSCPGSRPRRSPSRRTPASRPSTSRGRSD